MESYRPRDPCEGSVLCEDPVDLRGAMNQAPNYLEKLIQDRGASITVGPLPYVLGNKSQPTELMQSPLGNAIKYRSAHPLSVEVTAEPI